MMRYQRLLKSDSDSLRMVLQSVGTPDLALQTCTTRNPYLLHVLKDSQSVGSGRSHRPYITVAIANRTLYLPTSTVASPEF